MKKSALLILIIFILSCGAGWAQTAAINYQGKLTDGATPPTAQYDFIFKLFSGASGGAQIGSDVIVDDVQVTGGVFTVNLNFTSAPFTAQTGNYLEIMVRAGASGGGYTMLLPRQPITSSPYALQSFNARNLGGIQAANFVQNNDIRLFDERPSLGGSPLYLQNTTAQQSADFNISGSGTANVFNAAAQFNIGGFRALSMSGSSSISAGNFTGNSISGIRNSYFGWNAGNQSSTGFNNAFFGFAAGQSNTVGSGNTIIGAFANVSLNNLTNATAVGYNTSVSQSNSLVLGNGANVGIGTTAPIFKLQIVDSSNTGLRVQTDTTGGTVASFGGNGAFLIDAPGSGGGRFTVKENGNVGIGTNNPNTKLQIAGSVYIANPNSLIITSPNGACWFITVNNAGALSTISLPCP